LGKSLRERFDSKYDVDENDCWIWNANRFRDGYGSIAIDSFPVSAHRVAYQLFVGPIPDGMQVMHKCDVPSCVNPDHLELGTHLDNHRDKAEKWRGVKSKKGLPFGVKASGQKFEASCAYAGKTFYLGTYETKSEAAAAALAFKLSKYRRAA